MYSSYSSPYPYPYPSINAPLSYVLDANVENLVLDITHVYQQYYGSYPMTGSTGSLVGSSTLSMTALGNALDNDISVRSGGEVVPGQYNSMFLMPVNGSFTLYGDAGNDTLTGGDGADMLNGGQDDDVMDGGLGNDIYVVDAGDQVFEQAGGGIDTVVARVDGFVLGAEFENLRLDTMSGVLKGTGNAVGNLMVGNDQANLLDGLGGDDTISGGAGNDKITGGAGDDSIQGGSGNDVLDGGAQGTNGDTVSYAGLGVALKVDLSKTVAQDTGAGADTLTNFENLVGGTVGDTLTGNAGANKIWGGAGHDLIQGGGGADKLYGEAGNDTLVGGAGADVLSGGAGKDVFQFGATNEIGTTTAACDLIADFTRGQDRLDLSAIDANTTVAGNDAFVLLGAGATGFTAAGQLRFANGVLYGNTDADLTTVEFALQLTGVRGFSVADFIA
jgi:Ca2+-binding RTX toxin-like protein